jgi:hypothetical protein
MDLDGIVAAIWDPQNDPSDSRRYWLNRVVAASAAWAPAKGVLRGRDVEAGRRRRGDAGDCRVEPVFGETDQVLDPELADTVKAAVDELTGEETSLHGTDLRRLLV